MRREASFAQLRTTISHNFFLSQMGRANGFPRSLRARPCGIASWPASFDQLRELSLSSFATTRSPTSRSNAPREWLRPGLSPVVRTKTMNCKRRSERVAFARPACWRAPSFAARRLCASRRGLSKHRINVRRNSRCAIFGAVISHHLTRPRRVSKSASNVRANIFVSSHLNH